MLLLIGCLLTTSTVVFSQQQVTYQPVGNNPWSPQVSEANPWNYQRRGSNPWLYYRTGANPWEPKYASVNPWGAYPNYAAQKAAQKALSATDSSSPLNDSVIVVYEWRPNLSSQPSNLAEARAYGNDLYAADGAFINAFLWCGALSLIGTPMAFIPNAIPTRRQQAAYRQFKEDYPDLPELYANEMYKGMKDKRRKAAAAGAVTGVVINFILIFVISN